jgi:small neutral amino acid transporter SnatA (MarC family)
MPNDGYLITTVVALFAVMGVLTLPPVFLEATKSMTHAERRTVAFQTTMAVAITMLVAFFAGSYVLELFKINMDAFKVAGALVVASMAWGMIVARPSSVMNSDGKSPAIIPLAIPKTAGPGAIAVVIALGANHSTIDLVSNALLARFRLHPEGAWAEWAEHYQPHLRTAALGHCLDVHYEIGPRVLPRSGLVVCVGRTIDESEVP